MQEGGFLRPLNNNGQTSKVIDSNVNTTWNQELEEGKWKEMEQWREGQNSKEKLKGENGKKRKKRAGKSKCFRAFSNYGFAANYNSHLGPK